MLVLATITRRWQELLAPPRCLRCLQEMAWLCRDCQPHVMDFVQRCIVCQRPQLRGLTCLECRSQTPLIGVVSSGEYHTPFIQRGVQWLKFKGIQDIAPILAQLLTFRLPSIATFAQLQQSAYFVPVPLHYRRERLRGFNQSELLAHALSDITSIPTLPLLTRTKATWTQTKLSGELRRQNLDNAFAVTTPPLQDRSLAIIVDDVATTGSTLRTAALTLKPFPQVKQIWGATIARD